MSRMMERPALAPSEASGSNLIVAPLLERERERGIGDRTYISTVVFARSNELLSKHSHETYFIKQSISPNNNTTSKQGSELSHPLEQTTHPLHLHTPKPNLPPEPSALLYVPEACQARRRTMGHALALRLITRSRTRLARASSLIGASIERERDQERATEKESKNHLSLGREWQGNG
jgi:hypothetical protein